MVGTFPIIEICLGFGSLDPTKGFAPWNPVSRGLPLDPHISEFTFCTPSVHLTHPISDSKPSSTCLDSNYNYTKIC